MKLGLFLAAVFAAILLVLPVSAAKPAHAGPNKCVLTVSDTTVAVGEEVQVTVTDCPTNGNKTHYLGLHGGAGDEPGPLGYGQQFVGSVAVTTSWADAGTKFVTVTECAGRCSNVAIAIITVN